MSAYSNLVIADGAVAYWRLGETSGTTAVDSVGGKNGTISGGVTLGQPGPLADGDRAMRFANPTGQVRVAASGAYQAWGTGPATIEFWMNTGTVPSTGSFWLVDTKNATSITKGLGFDLETTPSLRFWCSDGTTQVVSQCLYSPYLNQWHHIVGVVRRGPDHLELWVDGVMKDSDAITAGADISSASGVMLGTYTGDPASSVYHYTGLLDEVAFYPTALTPAQIAAHYAVALMPTVITVQYPPGYGAVGGTQPTRQTAGSSITGKYPPGYGASGGTQPTRQTTSTAITWAHPPGAPG